MSAKSKIKVKPQLKLAGIGICAILVCVAVFFLFSSKSSKKAVDPITQKEATVMIDPGHGGFDPGKSAPEGVREADLNLAMALDVRTWLKQLAPHVNVILTRDTDAVTWGTTELDDLNHRTEMQKTWKADYFVSIHGNSFDDSSVYGYNLLIRPNDPASKTLAENIIDHFEEIDWSKNAGIITTDNTPLQVISMSDVTGALIETGYMTNPSDLEGLTDPDTQNEIAKAIASGIAQTIEKSNAPAASSSTENSKEDN